MLSYPACKISTIDEQVNILQITDLHLSTAQDVAGNDTTPTYQQNFEICLKQALAEEVRCDLILVTGDLVSRVDTSTYDYIFEVLHRTQIPFACIAGNHDVTDEFNHELPFDQRQLIARPVDSRLLNQHVIDTDHWQLLLLDSSVPGKVSGKIMDTDMDWLCSQLKACDKPALLVLHHHLVLMESAWIDAHMVKNADDFWQRMVPFTHLRAVTSGHTHQAKLYSHNGVTVYSTPSTCYQFKPHEDEFAYDEKASSGYRWLQLANNGNIASWVKD